MNKIGKWISQNFKIAVPLISFVSTFLACIIAALIVRTHNQGIVNRAIEAANNGDYTLSLELLDEVGNFTPAMKVRPDIQKQANEAAELKRLRGYWRIGRSAAISGDYRTAIIHLAQSINIEDSELFLKHAICGYVKEMMDDGTFDEFYPKIKELLPGD